MKATATSTVVAVVSEDGSKKIIADPSPKDIGEATSLHALAFTSHDELLLSESEGDFTVEEWDDVYERAQEICCQSTSKQAAVDMMLDDAASGPDMRSFLRSALETKVASDLYWK